MILSTYYATGAGDTAVNKIDIYFLHKEVWDGRSQSALNK